VASCTASGAINATTGLTYAISQRMTLVTNNLKHKSSGTSACSAKNDAHLGLAGVMNNPSACLRIRTSLTSAGKRNSCGSRTAWLAPFRNIDARLAAALDIDLAAAFDVTDLLFPVRARFITYPPDGNSRLAW
jgi:hypothetical protein